MRLAFTWGVLRRETMMNTRTLSPHEVTEFLSRLPMFSGVSEEQLQPFAAAAQQRQLEKGATLYEEGDDATHFYVLLKGWAKLSHSTADGNEVVIAMHSCRDVLGEYALFEEHTYKNSANVIEPLVFLSIPTDLLDREIENTPRITRNLLAGIVKCQRRHEQQSIQHMLYDAAERIGSFILGQLPPELQRDGATISLPYDKSLVAATLGMRGATFSRGLRTLRDKTGIAVEGNKVMVKSIARLEKYAGPCRHHSYPVEKKSCLT